MKVNIILVNECGEELIAKTIDAKQVEILGDCLDDFVSLQINKVRNEYPECRNVYREDVKSLAEERCEQAEAIYNAELEWALSEEGQEELDGYDPYEYAREAVDDYFRYGEGAGW